MKEQKITYKKLTSKEDNDSDREEGLTMATATKEQERETLRKMKKMVEKLGPDSYIGAALKGVWEIAERNIDLDICESVVGLEDELERAYIKIEALEVEKEYWKRLYENRR